MLIHGARLSTNSWETFAAAAIDTWLRGVLA